MENKIKYQPIVLFLACLAIAVHAEGRLKADIKTSVAIKLGKPMVLTCQAEKEEETKNIEWKKFSEEKRTMVNVDKISDLEGRYSIKKMEGNFIIEKPMEDDAGEYQCSIPNGDSKTIKVSVSLIVKVPENIYVVEGEKLEINCIVKGSDPKITWKFRKENDSETDSITYDKSDDRVKLSDSDDIDNAKLTIENAEKSDRGFYTCFGSSEHGNVTSEGFARVKDKYAALWPFVGICAEVFVLCTIILIYEKRRNKDSDNDSDTDNGDQKK